MNKSKGKKKVGKNQESSDSQHEHRGQNDYITSRRRKKGKNQKEREGDSSILQKYNDSNYRKYLQFLRDVTKNQMPKRFCDNPEINDLVCMGDNLCFYGYGSKREFLSSMRQKFFPQQYCWEVRGYLPTINVKKIYNNFGTFLKAAGVISEVKQIQTKRQLQQYRSALDKYFYGQNHKKLIVLFHCIDGQSLMNVESQMSLCELFSLQGIRILCTFDNIKIVMLWSPRIKQTYKFLFHDINTKIPSTEQQVYRPNPNQKTDRTQKRIMNIVQSLNSNQKRILKLIAKNQLSNLNRQIPYHYTVNQLLEVCIDEVILSNDTQLRQNLLELIDHDVIQEKDEETRAKKVLVIKLDKRLLQILLDLKVD